MADEPRLSRRDLFLAPWRRERPAPAPHAPHAPQARPAAAPAPGHAGPARVPLPVHRPPGATDEAAFLAGCTRCNACTQACPHDAIVAAPDRFRAAAGTPMIDPYTAACAMCPDAPCIAACEPGVLRPDAPRKMGVATIRPFDCLAHSGSFCTVCAERCPVPGAIRVERGRPSIDPDACTGCGTCAWVCPAPTNAVIVMPLADRPRPDSEAPGPGAPSRDA